MSREVTQILEGRVLTKRLRDKRWAHVDSKNLPGNPFIEDLKFYLRPQTLRLKYKLLMFNLEENLPLLYSFLTSIGFNKPSTQSYEDHLKEIEGYRKYTRLPRRLF